MYTYGMYPMVCIPMVCIPMVCTPMVCTPMVYKLFFTNIFFQFFLQFFYEFFDKFFNKFFIFKPLRAFGVPSILFELLKYNLKTSWPPEISIFKKKFTAKITLILMIKKMPLIFLDVEK